MVSVALPAFSSLATGSYPRLRAPPPFSAKSRSCLRLSRPNHGKGFTFVGASTPEPFLSRAQIGYSSRIERRFLALAPRIGGSGNPETSRVDEVDEMRGQSTMPERFRHLTKEAPDRPVSVVAFAPVPELMRVILFATAVLAIAEATVPDSVNSQSHLLALTGFIGFGVVKDFVPVLLFWLFLFGLSCYLRFIKKKDYTSALLPSAAVLAAVGEPWVRGLVMGSYLAVAIFQHSKTSEEHLRRKLPATGRRLPVPLLLAALAIGVHLAAKWVRHRHLTWMIA
ncbi:hypothetical protein B296_00035805 [Ensete ventricosum]|uniref:Uncharacterized protein n=1 Tax=Ensete ventricosum TaxID=4639 RepID=A0A426YBF5_ENSVE|nr:hypothetical protein B296_00035805 [Ensete ventricosum]